MLGIVFGSFVVLLFLGLPIAGSMIFSTLLPSFTVANFPGNLNYILRATVSGLDTMSILAIPLFMLSGAIMAQGGISRKLFDVFAVVVTCLFYGAISGSGPATVAAVGAMCIPVLTELGYDKKFAAAIVATAGGLGVIIPPSIPFIMYGVTTGESVGDMFTAGIVPGILIAVCLMAYCIIYCIRHGEDRALINKAVDALRSKGYLHVILDGFWALMTPVIILGGIYSGAVTPTEAACVSVFYAIIVCLFIYKTVKPKDLIGFLREGVQSYAPLGMMLALAQALTKVLVLLNAPQSLANALSNAFTNKFVFLLVLNIVLFLMGMVLDVGPAIMILAPMLLPFANAMGINSIHLGIVMTCNLAVGMVTPPFGMNLFVAAPMIQAKPMSVGRRALPFIAFYCVALMMITYIEPISMWMVG